MVTERPGLQPLEKWIDSFQFMGKRPMSEEEVSFLTSRLMNTAKPSRLVVLGSITAFLIVLLCLAGFNTINRGSFGFLLLLTLISATAIPVIWFEQLRRYREDVLDLSLAEVELYQTGNASLSLNRMVYLPRSNRVLSRQGVLLPYRQYLKVNLVASPQNLRHACFPRQFSYEGERLHLVRPLTRFERMELETLMPHASGWKWLLPGILWSLSIYGIVSLFMEGMNSLAAFRIVLISLAALSLTVYYGYRYHRRALVQDDLSRGVVICEKFGSLEFEHLEHSDLIWTVDATPAPWRTRSVISWFCPTI